MVSIVPSSRDLPRTKIYSCSDTVPKVKAKEVADRVLGFSLQQIDMGASIGLQPTSSMQMRLRLGTQEDFAISPDYLAILAGKS